MEIMVRLLFEYVSFCLGDCGRPSNYFFFAGVGLRGSHRFRFKISTALSSVGARQKLVIKRASLARGAEEHVWKEIPMVLARFSVSGARRRRTRLERDSHGSRIARFSAISAAKFTKCGWLAIQLVTTLRLMLWNDFT
jgi:hypothetical protein